MATIIDPKSVKLLVDGVELPFPVVAAPLSWEGVKVYTPPSEPDPFTFRAGGRGGKSKALAEQVATLDPDARIAVAGPHGVTITTAGEYSRSYAATFVPATESETVNGEQVLGELFEQAIGAALQRAEQAGAPIPYSDEGLGLLGSVVQQVMGNVTQEQVDDAWRSFLTEPPVRRDWPRRGYEPEQVRAVLQWVTSAGEFSRDELARGVMAVVFSEHVAEPGEELEGWTYASEWARDEAEGIAARVLRRAKRDRVVAWSHHSRCYYVRPAWQWRRPISRWWKWPLPYSDNANI